MEPRRFLRCLGSPGLFAATGEPIRFRTKKHLALLVYLAVEGRQQHRRDRLAELFWPRVPLAEARHSLATALSILRPRLGPGALEATRDQVALAPGRLELDLERLAAGEVLGTETTEPLEVAGFLEGFDIPDAREFALWKDRQHARWLPAVKKALVSLIDRCRRTGDSRQIEVLADKMLGLDDLSEEAIRAKMEARAFAGDRLTALRVYEQWRTKLAAEVNAVPSELLEGMAVRLRGREWERVPTPAVPTVPTDQWRDRPFIGRSTDYRGLYEIWENVKRGTAQHALILGDSGVGKTTLAERLTTAAGLEGAAVSRVQCYDLEREIPYAMLCNLLLGLVERPGSSGTAPEALAELARIAPDVRRKFPSIPASEESHGETARIKLTEAFLQLLHSMTDEHPVVLVVDDLHLADDASLAVLHLALRRTRGHPVMAVLIARSGDLVQSPQTLRFSESAESLDIRILELAPLSLDESRQFLLSLLSPDTPANASVRRALLHASKGYPLVLEILVHDWMTHGDQSLALALDAMTAEVTGVEPPTIYQHALNRLLRQVEPTTRTALSLAALLGRRLNDIQMYSLAELTVNRTMVSLAELAQLRVLRDRGTGLEFVNELVRSTAYLAVPSPLRKLLHGRIADSFIGATSEEVEALGLEIAWHCIRAGRTAQATPYLMNGARNAREMGALHEAERGLSTALSHLRGPDRLEAVLLLAEVLQEQGQWAQSLDLMDSEPLKAQHPSAALYHALRMMAATNAFGSTPSRLREDLTSIIAILRSSAALSVRVTVARIAAYFVGELRDPALANEVLSTISVIETERGPTQELSRLAITKAMLLFQLRDGQSTLAAIAAAASLQGTRGVASTTTCQLSAGLGALLTVEGRYAEAVDHYHAAYDIAYRLDNETMLHSIASNLALAYSRLGDYDRQIEWAERCERIEDTRTPHYRHLMAIYCLAMGHAATGRQRSAITNLNRVSDRVRQALPGWATQAWLLYSADVLWLAGEERDAIQAGVAGTTCMNSVVLARGFEGPFSRWKARGAQGERELEGVAQLLDTLATSLQSYDAIDRAELLAAIVEVDRRLGRSRGDYCERLRATLSELPVAVATQLTRLGFLSPASFPETPRRPSHLPGARRNGI